MVRVLTESDIVSLVGMKEAIDVLEGAFKEYSEKSVEMPLRLTIRTNQPPGIFSVMPSFLKKSRALGMKLVTFFPENPRWRGKRATQATILYNDSRTGELLAVMEGSYITKLRTGAASGLASKYLSRKDSKIVGILGSGPQAEKQLEALCTQRPAITKAKVYSKTKENRMKFASSMSKKLGIEVHSVDSAKEAVADSDIVSTATSAKEPVLLGEWLESGTHVNAIGSGVPDLKEIDQSVLLRADRIVADSISAAVRESGDLIGPLERGVITMEKFYSDLGDVVAGLRQGRVAYDEVTLFKSVGISIEDVAVAKFVYDAALQGGVGQEISLVSESFA